MKNFKKSNNGRMWGVLGKQSTYYSEKHFVGQKLPLNNNPLDSWDTEKSNFRRIDGYDGQQAGVVPQDTSPTPTPSNTATPNVTPSPTSTPTASIGQTPTPTPSITASPTQTGTASVTPTPTITSTGTQTPTPSITASPTQTGTASVTPTPTGTPTQTQSGTPNVTSTPTSTPTQTQTGTPNVTPTNTSTPTNTPSGTPAVTPTNTSTPTNTPSGTPAVTPTNTTTPTPTATLPASGTTAAQTYLRAVVDAGGTGITSTVSAATTTLFTSIVSNNLWDSLTAFYPMLGGNSAGCKFNAKNPTDLDASYRLSFVGGWTFDISGATSNGTNAYANTFLTASTLSLNNSHLSIYLGSNNAPGGSGKNYMGAAQSNYFLIAQDGTPNWFYGVNSTGNSLGSINTQGMIIAASSGTTNESLFRNGTRLTTASVPTRLSVGYSVYIGAMNNNGTAQGFYANQYRFATIGNGLTAAQASTLTTIINTFQTTLGRNTF